LYRLTQVYPELTIKKEREVMFSNLNDYVYDILICTGVWVSVKSMAILESDKLLQLLIASSDGYIKLYHVSIHQVRQL